MDVKVKSFRELSNIELFRIMEVRSKVFVLEQKITRCAELDETDLSAIHVFIEEEGRVLAYARCYKEKGGAHIGRVLTDVRGKGYGVAVMKEAIKVCKEVLGTLDIALSSQSQVVGFYEKLGFRVVSAPYDECGIEHYKMEYSLF